MSDTDDLRTTPDSIIPDEAQSDEAIRAYMARDDRARIAPIDRIESVRAQVTDVERQMEACHDAGARFSPKMTWQLLSACQSLLGPTLDAERAEARQQGAREAAGRIAGFLDVAIKSASDPDRPYMPKYLHGLREARRIARQEAER